MNHLPWVAELSRASLQSWLNDFFVAFCYVPSATHDYVLHTPDELPGNPFDIDPTGISYAILSGWPGTFSDISCSFYILLFSRFVSWLVGTLFWNNTSDALHGDCVVTPYHNVGK
jgi:hypothetical protein